MTLKNKSQKYRRIENLALSLTISGTILSSVAFVGTIGNACTYDQTNKQFMKDLAYLKETESYYEYLDSAYELYKNGDITAEQFKAQTALDTPERLIAWAKTLNDAEVNEIIAKYEHKVETTNHNKTTYLATEGFGISGILTGLILSKKNKKNTRQKQIKEPDIDYTSEK